MVISILFGIIDVIKVQRAIWYIWYNMSSNCTTVTTGNNVGSDGVFGNATNSKEQTEELDERSSTADSTEGLIVKKTGEKVIISQAYLDVIEAKTVIVITTIVPSHKPFRMWRNGCYKFRVGKHLISSLTVRMRKINLTVN
jgi:hypothetical protein